MLHRTKVRSPLQLTALVLALASSACGDRISGPDGDLSLQPSAASAATVEKGTGSFSLDEVSYWACVGEDIHNVFTADLRYTMVTNAAGSMYREVWLRKPNAGTITGLSSGTVWRRDIIASPFVTRDFGSGMTESVYLGRFVSETGPTLFVRSTFHFSTNANGVVTVDRFSEECSIGKP